MSFPDGQHLKDPISHIDYKERPIQNLGGITAPKINQRPHFGPGNRIDPLGPYNKADEPTYYHDVMYGKYGYFDKEADDQLIQKLSKKYPERTPVWQMDKWDQLAINTFTDIQAFFTYMGANKEGTQSRAHKAKIIGLENSQQKKIRIARDKEFQQKKLYNEYLKEISKNKRTYRKKKKRYY